MSGLLGIKTPTPTPPPPVPSIDTAVAARNAEHQTSVARGRATTVLTSDSGLPNLGTTSSPMAGGKNT